jgi:DNA-binding IclR family transcriptional regulator
MCKKEKKITVENIPQILESAMISQLSEECCMSKQEVISHLNELINLGYVSRTDSGLFKLNMEDK